MGRTYVIAGYFMWREAGPAWQRDMPRFPALGAVAPDGTHLGYDQGDRGAMRQHLRWALAHGLRVLAPIWRGRFDGGWDARMSDRIDAFRDEVERSEFRSMRWCVFLGNPVPDNQPPQLLEFGPPGSPTQVHDNFVASLTTGLRQRGWTRSERYLEIDGRPVVVVFRGQHFTGDYQGAIDAVRRFWDGEVFLVGMSCQWHRDFGDLGEEELDRLRAFDAVTAWSATAGTPDEDKSLGAVADFLRPRMAGWRDGVRELTVRGTPDTPVGFGPSVTCQYDKTKMKPGEEAERVVRWAREREDFRRLVEVARESLDPAGIGADGDRLVWLQTFNEWPEGTACEPTELGPGWPYADPQYRHHYGFDFLEVLRDELHPELHRTPREPLPVEPAAGAVVDPPTPTLRWDRVGARPAVTAYRVRLEAEGGGPPFEREVAAGPRPELRFPAGVVRSGGQYLWRVQARNGWGAGEGWSAWSRERRFRVR